jgi:hypothetical protein
MMRDHSKILFCDHNLDAVLRTNLARVSEEVNSIPEVQFLAADDNDVSEHIYSKMEVMPLVLYEDNKELDRKEIQIDVSGDRNRFSSYPGRQFFIPGIKIIVSIPYSGDTALWKCQPNPFNSNPPWANIVCDNTDHSGHIEIIIECTMDKANDAMIIKQEIDNTLINIRWYIENIKGNANSHNKELKENILQHVKGRRQRLGQQDSVAKALGIPMKKKSGVPDVPLPQMKRRILKPLASRPNQPPEPTISDDDYEFILNVIRHEGCTFETTPKTYAVHDEEGLRDIIIAHLNGHYQGSASGETFRKNGKTDIRIEDKNRAAFVGECKVWRGPKELSSALDQLLRYLTWRDCKASLIIFNKHIAGFSGVQKQIPIHISGHPNYMSPVNISENGEWRFKFHSAEDPDRIVIIHIFLFNLYTK